jgi:hypothetical protein
MQLGNAHRHGALLRNHRLEPVEKSRVQDH